MVVSRTYTAGFIYDNVMIASNLIKATRRYETKKVLNLGSSCICALFAPDWSMRIIC